MGLDQFMLLRFRCIEGILDDIKSWNLNECIFNDGSKITYDLKNEIITVERGIHIEKILFGSLTREKILSLGFKERTENRHNLSYEHKQED